MVESMAINISRLRNCRVYGIGLAEVIIILTIATGICIYLTSNSAKRPLNAREQLENTDDIRLKLYMEMMQDTRPKSCKSVQQDVRGATVSIIINFRDFQFYELVMVMKCLYERTPLELIDEVVIVDDGTKAKYLQRDLQKYTVKYKKLRIMRISTQVGRAIARMKAVRTTKSPILVFLDTTTIVNVGWLQPLIKKVQDDKFSIAVPHLDYITEANTFNLLSAPDNVVHVFTWGFSIIRAKVRLPPGNDNFLYTPVMRGNAFAVNRKYFINIGGYDENMEPGGGEDVELSLRMWMCRGRIVTALCSRVGVVGLSNPVQTKSRKNHDMINKLWIKDWKYQNLTKIDNSNSSRIRNLNNLAFRNRREYVDGMKCKSFDWYLKNVAPILTLPEKYTKYGILKSKSGLCASWGQERVVLGKCEMKYYDPNLYFTMNKEGRIMNRGLCMTAANRYYVKLRKCVTGKNDQLWTLTSSGNVRLQKGNECSMHVTDPAPIKGQSNQIMMLQNCNEKEKAFQSWTFEADAIDE